MNDPSNTPVTMRRSRFCGDCGYPVADGTCPECGKASVPRITIIEKSRTLGRVLRLLAFSWGGEAVAFVLSVLPSYLSLGFVPGGAVRGYLGFVEVVFLAAGVCGGLSCIALRKGPWALSSSARMLLRIAAFGFFLVASRRLLAVLLLMELHLDVLRTAWYFTQWSEWPAWILSGVAVVTLLRVVGVCSENDPGGRERPFLRHAWIPSALVVSLPMAMTISYFLLPIDGGGEVMGLLQLGRVVQILLLMTVVGGMIRWKRMLDRVAEHPGPIAS